MDNELRILSDKDVPWGDKHPRDTAIQIVLSVALGLGAFTTFCILRPRWPGLYAARKRHKDEATSLPELPNSLLGWIPALWKITNKQVLASGGLDAYVFLAFFRMAIKFLSIALVFALVVIKPVHDQYPEPLHFPGNDTDHNTTASAIYSDHARLASGFDFSEAAAELYETDYLWMYLVFAYFFTGLIMYLIVSETRTIIEIRQEYLGSQTTITDRTIRLSGIPPDLRSEEKIKQFLEYLEIGKVEKVSLCRNWKELDDLMVERMTTLRRLEEAWTVYLGARRVERNLESLPVSQPSPPGPGLDLDDDDGEDSHLLRNGNNYTGIAPYPRDRPKTRVWYGPWKLRYRTVDAIDYYETKMKRLDEQIKALRKKEFEPTPLAFVTMDSVASCQMAVQAVLDPSPLQLLANTSPAPPDVVWPNTYMPRSRRMLQAWSITFLITVLTVFWVALLVPIAGALNIETIKRVLPRLGNALDQHSIVSSLVVTQLPTIAVSLLNVLVPYLYDWLSNLQGMISQGDVELSVISKNFFFTFFNFFIVFTVLGTFSGYLDFLEKIGDSLKDTPKLAHTLASSLAGLLNFYVNFIILQGLGLFPFRLLEFGSLATYPIYRIGAKTPRDYAELVQPPIFSYGFYLPQTLLIFIICMVYSVLRSSWKVLLAGLAYFVLGHFVHKYQLLYAMDHRQHSTGRGWLMICDRVIVGTVFFQLTMAGQLALNQAFIRSTLIFPLILLTLWFAYVYTRTYRPLMKFIALRSIRRAERSDLDPGVHEPNPWVDPDTEEEQSEVQYDGTVDEAGETDLRFVNPSLIIP
ncbi:hypothetical protein W97_04208 [Coniosporium apollinis CBS 100218]|uniref:CSC1/OSCA1-like 7TM region domain-containing protein n=1 Tax=Coniosporium apollinis (strain CBS 100218) TaxID=1168221 RepID=R7YT11_CONA1|nr:uncharacterized protein W97_04208 [Coniosporium apollinis CBS 100218]EON64973.1 hypothetical protein W97_04208 [Coniosporium apollinis CBS 100218]